MSSYAYIFSFQIQLTSNDWALMPKVIEILKPIYDCSLEAEKDNCSVSDIIPLTKVMKKEILKVDEKGIGTFKKEILDQLKR